MVGSIINIEQKDIEETLRMVTDPEIPVLSIMDMGILRGVSVVEKQVNIQVTPTYSGCPAMDTIRDDIKKAISQLGYDVEVDFVLSPAWSTDCITEEGRKKLEAYGIAAPLEEEQDKIALIGKQRIIRCTNCGSTNTKLVSQFGSTACKALFQCEECLEPFDYFKCLK